MKYFIIIIFFSTLIGRTANHPHSDILDNRSCGERPSLEFSITSPSGHFVIHYDNYYNGIDQFAHSVGVAAYSSRHVIVDIMEFGIIIKKDVPIAICITKDCSIPIKVNI